MKVQIKESELKSMVMNALSKKLNVLKEDYYFGDANSNDEQGSVRGSFKDNVDYDLVYSLSQKFPGVSEKDMFDAVGAVWDYTKPQKENIQSLKDYLKPTDKYFNHSKVNETKKSSKQKKFDKVMGEFGDGTLKTKDGKKVTNKKQATAIAYSESGLDENTINNTQLTKLVENIVRKALKEDVYGEEQPISNEKYKKYIFEIYTKDPETGEGGYDISFVMIIAKSLNDAKSILSNNDLFDTIIKFDFEGFVELGNLSNTEYKALENDVWSDDPNDFR